MLEDKKKEVSRLVYAETGLTESNTHTDTECSKCLSLTYFQMPKPQSHKSLDSRRELKGSSKKMEVKKGEV